MKFAGSGHTDRGRGRTFNEDAMLGNPDLGLYGVVDGMGGPPFGEAAAATACNVILTLIEQHREKLHKMRETGGESSFAIDLVATAMQTACRQVWLNARAQHQGRGACTMSLALLAGRHAVIGHVGESRVYLVRDGAANLITEDHVRMVAASDGRSQKIVRRALGVQENVDVDTLVVELMPRDLLLFVTDGVSRYITDEEIAHCCRKVSYQQVPQDLIAAANQRGGDDNLTTVAVFVESVRLADFDPGRQIKVLRQVPIFKAMDYRELLKICDLLRIVSYKQGQPIITDGDTSRDFYILVEGKAEVRKLDRKIADLPTGACFGEAGLLDEGPRSADVIAMSPVKTIVMRHSDLMALFDADPALGVKALWSLARVLKVRLREITGELML